MIDEKISPAPTVAAPAHHNLRAALAKFQTPDLRRSLVQLGTTFAPFFALLVAMYWVRPISPWLSLGLGIPAGGLLVRIFIIQHDCGHGAYFRSKKANDWVGRFCSLFTLTPYANWRRHHAMHHAVWNNLDKRQLGTDLYSTCLTVDEYLALPAWQRFFHRLVRHRLVAHLVLPPVVFLLVYRWPHETPKNWVRERLGVYLTDLSVAGLYTGLIIVLGVGPVALVQIPPVAIAAIIGVWLFSVQHRFEDALWSRQPQWSANAAALAGSSYLKLPRILQWFSGNIGFHHIHHLIPGVPNYRLQDCQAAYAAIMPPKAAMSLREAMSAPSYALWDEAKGRLIKFSELPKL